jgi:hypothetical protein
MEMKEIKAACKLVPTFIKMCENDFQEVDPPHEIKVPLSTNDYLLVSRLITKLTNCDNFVDTSIFEEYPDQI